MVLLSYVLTFHFVYTTSPFSSLSLSHERDYDMSRERGIKGDGMVL